MTFLGAGTGIPIMILRAAVLVMVLWGAYESVATVFDAADASMGLMATINLIAIMLLSGLVVRLARDYLDQRRRGIEPVFSASAVADIPGAIDQEIWRTRAAPAE